MKACNISAFPTHYQGMTSHQLPDWGNLPEGLAGHFMSLLDDPRAARLTCKLWAREAASFRKHVCVSGPGPKGWLSRFHSLESLHWHRPRRDGTTRTAGEGLGRLSMLRVLELSGMCAGVLPKLQIPETLLSLSLEGCRDVIDNDLTSLSRLTQLKTLDLTSCGRITNRGLAHLKTLTGLAFLSIDGTEITDIKELAPLKSLCVLLAFDCRIPDDGLYCDLPNFSSLDTLILNVEVNSGATLRGALERLPALRHLGLSSDPIREEHTEVLQHLPHLTTLWLQHCTDVRVETFARNLPNLSVLGLLDATGLTDAGTAELGRMTRLSSLYISHSPMTDAGLSELRHLTGLKQLDLTACDQITNFGLLALRNFRHLNKFSLWDCANITDDGINMFTILSTFRLAVKYGVTL